MRRALRERLSEGFLGDGVEVASHAGWITAEQQGRHRQEARAVHVGAHLPYAVGYARRSSELFPNTALDLGDGRLNGSRPVLTVFKTERDSLDYNIVSKAIKEKDPVKRNQKLARVRGSLKQYRGECVLDRAALGLM